MAVELPIKRRKEHRSIASHFFTLTRGRLPTRFASRSRPPFICRKTSSQVLT